jgi:hypothetical protein
MHDNPGGILRLPAANEFVPAIDAFVPERRFRMRRRENARSICNSAPPIGMKSSATVSQRRHRLCAVQHLRRWRRDPGATQLPVSVGTAQGASTLRTLHADVTGKLGDYGITSPLAKEGVAVNVGYEHRNDHEFLQPDSAQESGLLSGFGSAVAPTDNSIAVSEEFIEVRVPPRNCCSIPATVVRTTRPPG